MDNQELDYDFNGDYSRDCRGLKGWDKETCEGQYFGNVIISEQKWAIVLWEDEENPVLYQCEGIEVAVAKYVKADLL